ncbi:MAG: aminotransferase class V-fold PLP-dependent enzyme, partial [Bacillota bacterium]
TGKPRGNVVSFVLDGMDPGEVSMILDSAFQIAVRSGLHCARDTHETIGTLEKGGTLRVSPNYFNSNHDIEQCIDAIRSIRKGI